jgi:hypothetical protein
MRDAEPLQRFEYVEEYVKAGCFCCGDSSYRAASVVQRKGNSSTSGYIIKDAIYETLAMYLEDEVRLFGGPDEYVKTQLCVKANTKQPVPFQFLPKMGQFMQTAAQDTALKTHLLAVLWSLLPLNLELRTVRNKERPQHFGKSTSMMGGPQEVILNPNPQAQEFWRTLQALKVCK